MIAEELINQMIPALRPEDSSDRALSWMEEYRCTQLPVVEDDKFLGFITEEILLGDKNREKPISRFSFVHEACTITSDAHFYEVVRIAGEHKTQTVAVLNNLHLYSGVIQVGDIMATFSQSTTLHIPGSTLVLSLDLIDYSLAEIARLVEENKAKIITATMVEDPLDKSRVRLTLKVNQTDPGRIVATLERFGYRLIGRYQETRFTDPEKERFDLLMRYLNI